jgi:superfamily II DNA or RNA helicase
MINRHNKNIIKEDRNELPEKFPTLQNTYLGNKGYTILKSELSVKQQFKLKEMLMVKPYVPGSPVQVQKTFPSYRESDKKMYVPRYFGEDLFGPAKIVKISDGDTIDIAFQGELRENQVPVVDKYLQHVTSGGGGLLELPCGFGKTSISLHIISRLSKKTLVIVHKEFLMNQWIERIHQFLPTAKIGKIQGQIIDIDGKDIVLCMLQSLSMKDYPSTLFDSFGFTIIDEVHHISSEVFSCALFKLVTKYMLGLSATMNRKDGTTKVFKMFLGQVVYKQERSKDEEVIVRGITYQINDDEYNELELDFRGQTAASKMLSKICNYNRRTEFIVKVLKDMILENPKQQIMIIASYKNILNYLYDAIVHQNITTVGYYVGGMKESALKESESKQVVLATYSMAAEGLDIKSLTTLFMITPMTNIEQSVGRILRQKHEFAPIVVDIVDTHDNFQRQWTKRKTFYKKQNYKIIQTNSTIYNPDASKWKLIYEPTSCKSNKPMENTMENTKELINPSDTSSSYNSESDEETNIIEEIDTKKDKLSSGVCFLKIKKII